MSTDIAALTVNNLIKSNTTITCMESVTGGLLASLITDIEGSSAVFKGSFVTYSNEAKIKAGVDANIIKEYGVYSHECARAMATASRMSLGADIGIGVTGVLSNIDPSNKEGIPGKVYFAIDHKGSVESYIIDDIPLDKRPDSKLFICRRILEKTAALTEK
ncbi:MAG: nicotinamide-nucleotide amidohydrolase family protein [Lachnospiraceae bacterium]|nr:nicotinamide-nucleotide amidohydrolase family protein [Lachnospiraceae bacterium]